MSAQEEPAKTWYQIRVVTEHEVHHSIIEEYAPRDLEELHDVLSKTTRVGSEDGMSFSFTTEGGGGKTFIPARWIRYITVQKVDPPE